MTATKPSQMSLVNPSTTKNATGSNIKKVLLKSLDSPTGEIGLDSANSVKSPNTARRKTTQLLSSQVKLMHQQ